MLLLWFHSMSLNFSKCAIEASFWLKVLRNTKHFPFFSLQSIFFLEGCIWWWQLAQVLTYILLHKVHTWGLWFWVFCLGPSAWLSPCEHCASNDFGRLCWNVRSELCKWIWASKILSWWKQYSFLFLAFLSAVWNSCLWSLLQWLSTCFEKHFAV